MSIKKTFGEKVFDVSNILIMVLISAVMLYPMIYMLALSFSSRYAVEMGIVTIWPIGFHTQAYKQFFEGDILLGYYNSIRYAVIGTIISLIMNAMMAYPLSDKSFIVKKYVLFYISFTMYFGAGLIPWYMVIRSMGMIDNIWGIIIPSALSAYNIIIFRTFFKELPAELKESAFIDGANDFTILFKIIIPLSKPVFVTVGLWVIVGHWNSFFTPFIVLNSPKKFPLQLVIANIVRSGMAPLLKQSLPSSNAAAYREVSENALRAAAVIATSVPILAVYPFLQKYFVKGVMIGSIKG
jgi:putative aldouronate transport system permease protein